MSRNAPPKEGGVLRDIQKTAARETSIVYALCLRLLFSFTFHELNTRSNDMIGTSKVKKDLGD